jgi:O-antigen/teichoic acid export membrane protein
MNSKISGLYAHALLFERGNSSTAAVFQTIGVRAILLVINFGTGIIVARSLGPIGRGELAAIGLWPTFLAALATLGLPTALAYNTRRQPENGSQNFVASALVALAMGMLAAAVGVLFMPLFLHGYDPSIVRAAQAFMAFAPQVLLAFIVRAHLEALGEFRRSILAQLNPTVVTLVALFVLRLTGHLSAVPAALSYAIPFAVQTLWLAVRLWPRTLYKVADLMKQGRNLLGYGLRSYGTDVIGALASQLDLAVIVMFLSAAQLGLYSIALTLSRLLSIVQTSLVSVLFPRASSLGPEEGIALIDRTARLSTVVSIGLGIAFLVAVPIVLPRLYGEQFSAAILLMPLLSAEAVVSGFGGILKQSFLASGRPFVGTLIEAGSILCAIGLLFLLVPRMNILGAATALLCTSLIRVGVIMLAYRFVLDRPMPRLLPCAADLDYLRAKMRKPPAAAHG